MKRKTKKVELTLEVIAGAGVPEKYWKLDMSRFEGDEYGVEVVKAYCSRLKEAHKRGVGLFCQGDYESGKTLFACNVVIAALAEGFSAQYYSFSELMDGMFARTITYKDILTPDFLVVDNVNADTNAASDSILRRVIFARKDSGKPLILCSRLIDKQFAMAYSAESLELISRICKRLPTSIDAEKVTTAIDDTMSFLHESV